MAKGIYSSGLSCYQRRMAKLPQDNAGPEPIDGVAKAEVKAEKEVVKEEVKPKKAPANTTKKSGL